MVLVAAVVTALDITSIFIIIIRLMVGVLSSSHGSGGRGLYCGCYNYI